MCYLYTNTVVYITSMVSEKNECSVPRRPMPRDPEPWVFQGGFGAELSVRFTIASLICNNIYCFFVQMSALLVKCIFKALFFT